MADRSTDDAAVAGLESRAATLTMLEQLLGTSENALSVREVLDRLFDQTQGDLPHDAMSISFVNNEQTHIQVYATSGALRQLRLRLESAIADPTLVTRPWEFELIEDMNEHPRYRVMPSARAGMRSAIVIPLRFGGQLRGWVNFFSRAPRAFHAGQAAIARRIASHVALTLSYDLLAEQGRRNEELRARAANLELLDALLAGLADTADIADLLGGVSTLAGKVLAHDAVALTVYVAEAKRALVYAHPPLLQTGDLLTLVADFAANAPPDAEIVDDLNERGETRYTPLREAGFNSMLCAPMRIDDRKEGAMIFLAKATAAFQQADVLVANRIAARVTVTIARSRELEASKRADEAVERAARLEVRVRALTEELDTRTGRRLVVGDSPQWKQVLTHATQVAPTNSTVLLLGDSGTGKEVVARFIHRASQRSNGPFVALNCAALPEHLLEAELFGYERGAFTGATQSKPGHLEQAAGGTLFLDEVGEMALPAQAKFLRVLQEREFQRLGGTRVLRTDARIVAATNRDLRKAMTNHHFREDLYYRLNVFVIHLPRLRDRHDDILPLSEALLTEIGKEFGRPPSGISRPARDLLLRYTWPGNVRELRNVLERAAILCDGGLITEEHLALDLATATAATPRIFVPMTASAPAHEDAAELATMERAMIQQALQEARFNKSKAAKRLGLTRHQLYLRMRKHGLDS